MIFRTVLLLTVLLVSLPARALYDPVPETALAAVEGAWSGSLTYRDYSPPHGLVTLPTRLYVTLGAPDALVMHYVYDDGPGKTVHSYESVRFDFAGKQVTWTSGAGKSEVTVGRIVADAVDGQTRRIVVETAGEDGKARHTFEFSDQRVAMKKEELDTAGAASFRDSYEFRRP